jgi:hypothetical protein
MTRYTAKAKQKFIDWLLADEDTYLPETHVGPNSLKVGSRDITDEDNSTTIYDGSAQEIGDGNQSVNADDIDITNLSDGSTKKIIGTAAGDNGDRSLIIHQTTNAVGTTAEVILQPNLPQSHSGAFWVQIFGYQTNGDGFFWDYATFTPRGGQGIGVRHSEAANSPDARTYSEDNEEVKLAMGGNTYDIVTTAVGQQLDYS